MAMNAGNDVFQPAVIPKEEEATRVILSRGCVRFPTESPKYINTRQGGMFVRLVVDDTVGTFEEPRTWMLCSGGAATIIYDGIYLQDDARTLPKMTGIGLSCLQYFDGAMGHYRDRDFPRLSETPITIEKYVSVPYLCCMTIGSIRWTGFDESDLNYWHCTKIDLTDAGLDIVDSLSRLYNGCSLRLQTWMTSTQF